MSEGDEIQRPESREIAALLDQCTPEELANILNSIEGGSEGGSTMDPVPPSGPPPPAGAGAPRRPVRAKPAAAAEVGGGHMDQIKQLLQEQAAGIITEVQKSMSMPGSAAASGGDSLDLTTLTLALAERDKEVLMLETKLAGLRSELASKDHRAAELGEELNAAVREVRHRQLDLEFQQLKLEERVRSNAEIEQSQRALAAQAEEAGLNARHAALDAEMGRMATPRSIRAQGTLPWMLRKNQLMSSSLGSTGGSEPR